MSESPRARWLRRLRTGEGVSPNWSGVMAIAYGLAEAEVPEETMRTLLLEPSSEGTRYIHFSSAGKPRPTATRERMVREAIRKARARQAARPRDRASVIETLGEIRLAIDSRPDRWRGRAGATDRAVLLAAISIAERLGRLEFDESVRGLADEAGVGVKAAHTSTRRRLSAWLRIVEVGVGTRASRWRLQRLRAQPTGSVFARPTDVGCRDERTACVGNARRHDVFRWTALGKSTLRIYELLDVEPVGTSEIAIAAGIAPVTARTHLARLAKHDLAVRVLDGWVIGPAELDGVAGQLGVAGRGDDERRRHALRAEQRRAYVDERRRRERALVLVGEMVSGGERTIVEVGAEGGRG